MTTAKYTVGDTVNYKNSNGVKFGKKTITGIHTEPEKEVRYFITPTDTPWFPIPESQLSLPR